MSERPEFCTAATGQIWADDQRCQIEEFGVHRCADSFDEPHAIHICACEFQWISKTNWMSGEADY